MGVGVVVVKVKRWVEEGRRGGEMVLILVLVVGCGVLLGRKLYKNG